MRKQLIFICTLLCFAFHAQNWNVFNKNYRYNYKFDHSDLVSNVLFVDSIKQAGVDTIYYLNRIGVECKGTCPTVTAALNPTVTYVVPNMPQFLQRKIKKYANGLVMLLDTSKQVIIPTSTVTQTWRFDSIYNFDAACVSAASLTVFGQSDSVKTIIVNGTDTLLLSKNFGILQFPEPYTKNKYYRLAGIENKNSYDQTALYGEKVPNAWDFYSYSVGDIISLYNTFHSGPNGFAGCYNIKSYILSINTSSLGILTNTTTIGVSKSGLGYNNHMYCSYGGPLIPGTSTGTSLITSTALSTPTNIANKLYPGMIYAPLGFGPMEVQNITKFGIDFEGRFYKYAGRPCYTYTNYPPQLPNKYATQALAMNNNLLLPTFQSEVAIAYGVGFGLIRSLLLPFEKLDETCLTSFVHNGVTYFGPTKTFDVGMTEHAISEISFHPNPASTKVMLPEIEGAQVKVYNSLGQLVLSAENQSSIDVSSFQNGIYLLTLENSSFKISKKLVVEH